MPTIVIRERTCSAADGSAYFRFSFQSGLPGQWDEGGPEHWDESENSGSGERYTEQLDFGHRQNRNEKGLRRVQVTRALSLFGYCLNGGAVAGFDKAGRIGEGG